MSTKIIERSVTILTTADNLENMRHSTSNIELISGSFQTAAAIGSLSPPTAILTAPAALVTTSAKVASDASSGKAIQPGDILSITGNVVGIIAAVGVTLGAPVAIPAAIITTGLVMLGRAINILNDPNAPQWFPKLPPLPPSDPLSLDLNQDGKIGTLGKEFGVYFDLDNSGFAEKTAWLSPEDGLLVLDRNGNGYIDGGAELFGTETQLADGSFADNGFIALKEFDENGDGVIDANDAIFDNLQVWVDANSDGVSQDGELKTLAELGIKSINTDYTTNSVTDAQNVEHREHGTFTFTDGAQAISNTLWFDSDRVQTKPVDIHNGEGIAIDADIAALPNAVGFGNVYALHDAMQRDSSGKLQTLVRAFIKEGNIAQRHTLSEQILTVWAGKDGVAPDSRGSYMNAQQLEVLEAFLGQEALQTNPTARYAASLQNVYDDLLEYVYTQLSLQTHYATEWKTIAFNEDNGNWTADFSNTATWLSYQVALGSMDVAKIQDFKAVIAGIVPDNKQLETQLVTAVEA